MSELYDIVPLSTVVQINSGIALPKIFKDIEKSDGEFPFYKVAQMNNDTKIMKGAELRFTEEESKKFKIKLFPKGSVLIPKRGGAILTNKKRLLTEVASYDSNIMGLKADNKILIDEFLMIYMESITLSDYIDTSTIPQINNKHIALMKIPLPPLKEQKRIVAKLDTLFTKIDKAIALHQQNIDEAKALMGSVLDEVFGELEGRYEKKYLDTLLDIIDGDRGKNYPKKSEFTNTGYCLFLNAKNVTKNGFKLNEKQFISKEKDSLLRKGKLEKNDLIITTRGTIGNIALYDDSIPYDIVRINSGMAILRLRDNKILERFLYKYLISPQFINYLDDVQSGSA